MEETFGGERYVYDIDYGDPIVYIELHTTATCYVYHTSVKWSKKSRWISSIVTESYIPIGKLMNKYYIYMPVIVVNKWKKQKIHWRNTNKQVLN